MGNVKLIHLTLLETKLIEVQCEHPYKIPGNRDSYSKYNEGWSDAIDRILGILEQAQNEQKHRCGVTNLECSECQPVCGSRK